MTRPERITRADRMLAAPSALAGSGPSRGGARARRPHRPRGKPRPAQRWRRCFDQAMAEVEDFERRLTTLELALLAIGTRLGIPM